MSHCLSTLILIRIYNDALYTFGLTASGTPVTVRINGWITTVDIQLETKETKPILLKGCINDEKSRITSIIRQFSSCSFISHNIVELFYDHNFEVEKQKFHRISLKIESYSDYIKLTKELKKASFILADTLFNEELFMLDYNLKPTQWLQLNIYVKWDKSMNVGRRNAIEITVMLPTLCLLAMIKLSKLFQERS